MTGKIFCSDEGWGHLVRQQAIAGELMRLKPDLQLSVQTSRQAEAARWIFPETIPIHPKFNNISWAKDADGSPSLEKIRASFIDYERRSDRFIEEELREPRPDFFISDFVYEAFSAGAQMETPSFGVAHFTWDWFFSKLYPPPVRSAVLERWFVMAHSAEALFFPPFTPPEILRAYAGKAVEVPFIVRQRERKPLANRNGKFRVLIMDSGAGVLSEIFREALATAEMGEEFEFIVSAQVAPPGPGVTAVERHSLLADHVQEADLVLSRGGFNTISECIADRVPILVAGESRNPEMEANLLALKQSGLGSFVSIQSLRAGLTGALRHFVDGEYQSIRRAMQNHDLECDGARQIAERILDAIT